jgi:hypothetical protein
LHEGFTRGRDGRAQGGELRHKGMGMQNETLEVLAYEAQQKAMLDTSYRLIQQF